MTESIINFVKQKMATLVFFLSNPPLMLMGNEQAAIYYNINSYLTGETHKLSVQ